MRRHRPAWSPATSARWPPAQTVAVAIRIIPPAAADIVNTATVQATTPDPVPSNNCSAAPHDPSSRRLPSLTCRSRRPTPPIRCRPVRHSPTRSPCTTPDRRSRPMSSCAMKRHRGSRSPRRSRAPGNCTTPSGVVTCALGTLAVGQDASITVTAVAGAAGVRTNYASVSATQPDPVPANNTAVQVTTVSNGVHGTGVREPDVHSDAAGRRLRTRQQPISTATARRIVVSSSQAATRHSDALQRRRRDTSRPSRSSATRAGRCADICHRGLRRRRQARHRGAADNAGVVREAC